MIVKILFSGDQDWEVNHQQEFWKLTRHYLQFLKQELMKLEKPLKKKIVQFNITETS